MCGGRLGGRCGPPGGKRGGNMAPGGGRGPHTGERKRNFVSLLKAMTVMNNMKLEGRDCLLGIMGGPPGPLGG